MKSDFVFITSLYNIEELSREDRSWEKYLEWFYKTLQINCPFIIFCDSELEKNILDVRDKSNTHIICEPYNKIPLYYLKDIIQNILDSSEYVEKMADNHRIECKKSMYSIIQYSKFKWLKISSKLNPFNSKFFFWIDAGASRFIGDQISLTKYPSDEALDELNNIGDTFLLQYNIDCYPDLSNSHNLTKDYFWDCRSFTCGSMFGGNSKSLKLINNEIDDIINYMIDNKCVNNEQIALGYLSNTKSHLFTKFYRNNFGNHLCLFNEMI